MPWKPALVLSALVLSLHVLSFMLVYAAIAAEYVLLRGTLDRPAVRALAVADAVYGGAAVGVFATGIVQVLYVGKGYAYYVQNPILWTKIGLFTLAGLASIYPTITFLKWQSALDSASEGTSEDASLSAILAATDGDIPAPSAVRLRRLRRIVLAELGVFTLLPILGSALRYGFG